MEAEKQKKLQIDEEKAKIEYDIEKANAAVLKAENDDSLDYKMLEKKKEFEEAEKKLQI